MKSLVRYAAMVLGAVAIAIVPGVASAGTASAPVANSPSALLQKVLADLPQIIGSASAAGSRQTMLVAVNPNGTLNPNATSPAKCHYSPTPNEKGKAGTIGDPHKSTSILKKRKVNATKVNSFIVCDRKVSALENKTYLYKLVGAKTSQQATATTTNKNESVLANQKTYKDCSNSKKTTWEGAALGFSIEGGKLYVGVGVSPHSFTWDCGT